MRTRRRWTEEEDQVLIREATIQLETGALKQWSLIADNLPGRTNKDCRKRWAKLGNEVKRGTWSSDEDEKLQSAIAQVGFKWTQVAEIVGTRHAEQCAKRWQHSLDPSLDHSNWDSNEDQLLMESVTRHGRNWKTIRSEELPHRSTTDIKNRHTMLIRKPQSHTTSTRTRETSPRFSNAEQFVDDDFTLNETFYNEESTDDQILPDALNALFPQELDTTTTEASTHPSADASLQHSRHDSGMAISTTTNTSNSPSHNTTYRPPTADMYNLNINPLATSMWPSDWVARSQATSTHIDVSSSSSDFFNTTGSNSTAATTASSTHALSANSDSHLSTTQNDDFLWTDFLPTIPPPDPLRPATSLAHDTTESSTRSMPLELMSLDADMPPNEHHPPSPPTSASTHPINTRKPSEITRPSRQNRKDPEHLVAETSSMDEDVHNYFEERLARKRKRFARGASVRTAKSRTTLVLEDVEPETLKTVMDTLLQSKTRISMTHGTDDIMTG
ncbi:hypothetical protein BDR22DRAFT_717997 [Usnea florida]